MHHCCSGTVIDWKGEKEKELISRDQCTNPPRDRRRQMREKCEHVSLLFGWFAVGLEVLLLLIIAHTHIKTVRSSNQHWLWQQQQLLCVCVSSLVTSICTITVRANTGTDRKTDTEQCKVGRQQGEEGRRCRKVKKVSAKQCEGAQKEKQTRLSTNWRPCDGWGGGGSSNEKKDSAAEKESRNEH